MSKSNDGDWIYQRQEEYQWRNMLAGMPVNWKELCQLARNDPAVKWQSCLKINLTTVAHGTSSPLVSRTCLISG